MNIRNMKYGISAVCIAALVLLTSGCKRDELETVKAQDDVIKFAFGDGSLPELKSGAAGASGEVRTIALEGDADGMVLYRTERASDSFFGYVSETKGTPVTTANLSSLYMDEFFTTAYDADNNSKFANPVKLAYEEIKENKSIWRVTESFAWPEKDGKLSFWAWAPNDIVAPTKTIKDSEGKMTFTYTMPVPGTATDKKDAEAQKDIILGHTTTGKPDNYIDMNMIHALSGLRFEMDNSVSLNVKRITLNGILSKGDCTFTPDASKTHAYEQVAWADLSDKKNYSQDFDQTIISGTGEDEQEIGAQEATFMVIPQCATNVSFDLTYEKNGQTKHITANLTGEDWKAGVTYVYNIGHPAFDKHYLVYHWNDGKHIGADDIFHSEEYPTSGPHDIILQEPSWSTSTGGVYYTFLGWASSPSATEAEYIQPGRQAETGLKSSITLTTETTNLYAVWKEVQIGDAWIDYENYIFNNSESAGVRFDHLDDWGFNEFIKFTISLGYGYFEKVNFPIHNLVPGNWYRLTFSEKFEYYKGDQPGRFWNPDSSYSTTVAADPNTDAGDGEKHKWFPMIPQKYDYGEYHYRHYLWAKNQYITNQDYSPTSDQSILFYATAETMYWIWDLSKCNDLNYFTYKFSHSDLKLVEVPEDKPTVDFLSTSYYGFHITPTVVFNESPWIYGYSTFKVNAKYNDYLEMYTAGKSGVYEKINIPLINLTPNKEYKLTFSHERKGRNLTGATQNCDYCYAVISEENKDISNHVYHNDSGYVTNRNAIITDAEISFTATGTTMYWVWSVSELRDASGRDDYNILYFTNASIVEVTE